MEDWQNGGFGLYLHWPFCQSKCPYCDFNSHVAAKIDQTRWRSAYLAEIDRAGRETKGRVLQTVFFGGGTPSLMDGDLVAAIMDKIRATWTLANDPEITMEANPGSVEAGRFSAYREAGVNRVSVGIQALDDDALRLLGRTHSVADARRAYDIATATFPRVSFDLIYARQGQSKVDWRHELNEALSMDPTHLSLYQLTIEDGTVFGARHARGQLRGMPDEDRSADMYLLTQDICARAGLPAYEVSNHAKVGQESRHNLIYWRGGDYIGIGPGAHGRLTSGSVRRATEAPKMPEAWLRLIEAGKAGELPSEALSARDRAAEYLMMGLRLDEGVHIPRYASIAGAGLQSGEVLHLSGLGLIETDGETLRATSAGRLLLNQIIAALVPS
ncbi:MAG: radical SAM family heme chaperone HemW [Paracoccaceae bacterium]